ncbi:MAG: hypothetical protein HN341_08325, partial [Verrucomicrobia bacterium]|nr:hypothetical protein [Verrucomicrobiota bacterium]
MSSDAKGAVDGAATKTRDRAIQLFTYLQELSGLRSTQTSDVDSYDEVLWWGHVPRERGCQCVAWNLWVDRPADKQDERTDVWLEVQKPRLKSPPEVPDELDSWIKEIEVENSELEEPGLYDQIVVTLPPEEGTDEELTEILSLETQPQIFELWMAYVEQKWKPWAEEDRRLQEVQRVYNGLFTIYQRAEKLGEQYETVVGVGLLTWRSPNSGDIRHPILTLQARVEFDRARGIMSVVPGAEGPQPLLDTDMLETEDRPAVTDLQAIQAMVVDLDGEPWHGPSLEAALKSFANGISTQSVYDRSLERPARITEHPSLHLAPALLLRKRTRRSFVDFYKKIIEQLEEGVAVPDSVRRLVDIVEEPTSSECPEPGEYEHRDTDVPDTELYFPLPANDEQKRIAERIEHCRGLLVQGPPGTGKSHTIVNLIAHCLAKGRRVLVTSETPRALHVLSDKLPQEIRELCVMWLGVGPAAQKSLEKSVGGITQQKVSWDPAHASDEIDSLEKRLVRVRSDQARLRQELTACREEDTYQYHKVFERYSGTLEHIAIQVAKERDRFAWLMDRPGQDDQPAVTAEDLLDLVHVHRQLTDELLQEIQLRHFPSSQVIPPPEFQRLVADERAARLVQTSADVKRDYPGYDLLGTMKPASRVRVLELLNQLLTRLDQLSKHVHVWAARAAREIAADQDRVWRELLDTTEGHIAVMAERSREIGALDISGLEGHNRTEVAVHAEALKLHLDSGKRLGFGPFRARQVKQGLYLIKVIRVDGRPCASSAILQQLLLWLDFERRCRAVNKLWEAFSTPPAGNYAVQVAAYQDLCEPLRDAVGIHSTVEELKRIIAEIPGLTAPQWHVDDGVVAFRDAVEAIDADEALRRARASFAPLEQELTAFAALGGAHPAVAQLHRALQQRDTKEYAQATQALHTMHSWAAEYQRICVVLARFSDSAPRTSAVYEESVIDLAWDERFAEFADAWAWAQADRWIEEMCAQNHAIELTESLESAQADERKLLRRLAAKKAWQHCMEELGEAERQALIAWMHAVARIRRGTGRHAERHRNTARQKLT